MIAQRTGLVFILVLLLYGVADARAAIGKPAPKYTITLWDHAHVTQEALKGKVVVLNYWATWCAPCRLEMVVMENYIRTHPDTDLRIFAINIEESLPPEVIGKLRAGLSFPVAYRLAGSGYGVLGNAVPTSYVIDRGGVVRTIRPGPFDDQSFDATVSPLLAGPAPMAP